MSGVADGWAARDKQPTILPPTHPYIRKLLALRGLELRGGAFTATLMAGTGPVWANLWAADRTAG